MTVYTAPSKDLKFVIETLADYPAWHSKSGSDFDLETVSAVIDEAARFAEQVLAPINRLGDQQGAKLSEQGVTAPKEFVDAYRQFVDSGWNSLGAPTEHGGQGGPKVLGAALQEIWQAANMAWSLCPMLSQGAVEALVAHGSTEQKKTYLPKLISGAWAGTMVLTEPQAGSDLGALQCKATPAGDHYLIQGQKIFITWGEHNMADNIVHLVLARLPDAPPGVKGISMFLVPRFLLNDDGSVGKANDLHCSALEHKLGIHASPTCVMNYGDNEGAIGYLIGEENQGLALMFTMMNDARLAVGIEGIGVADRAYQLARDYAKQRVQGNLPGEKERVTIIHHPNVRRMLLLMKTQIEAMRAVAITTAMTMDRCAVMKGNEEQFWQKVVSLLVPVVKAWCTETAQEVCSLGVQIHGGMGYIEETGAAQFFRDARIATIYEGTTGIQAKDFLGRKILRDQGATFVALLDYLQKTTTVGDNGAFSKESKAIKEAFEALNTVLHWTLNQNNKLDQISAAFNFLMATGATLGGYWLLETAARMSSSDVSAPFGDAKTHSLTFYVAHVLPRVHGYAAAAMAGSDVLLSMSEAQF